LQVVLTRTTAFIVVVLLSSSCKSPTLEERIAGTWVRNGRTELWFAQGVISVGRTGRVWGEYKSMSEDRLLITRRDPFPEELADLRGEEFVVSVEFPDASRMIWKRMSGRVMSEFTKPNQ
jgi:hypothetical protein